MRASAQCGPHSPLSGSVRGAWSAVRGARCGVRGARCAVRGALGEVGRDCVPPSPVPPSALAAPRSSNREFYITLLGRERRPRTSDLARWLAAIEGSCVQSVESKKKTNLISIRQSLVDFELQIRT